jgi:hypothetical protein
MITKFNLYENVFENTIVIIRDKWGSSHILIHDKYNDLFTFEFIGDIDESTALDDFIYNFKIVEKTQYNVDEMYDFLSYVKEQADLDMSGFEKFINDYKPRKAMIDLKQKKFNL